jgi:tRNA threonylcarbamoyladenosine biosynthesis protein TsaE
MSGAGMATPDMLRLGLGSRRDTQTLGRALAAALQPGDLVVLEGSLGAGKTYLVQSIARGLGVPTGQPVTSPTFEILHEFQGRVPIVHADLYRLATGEPLDELGLLEGIGAGAVTLVEWGERFAGQLGNDGLWVFIELRAGKQRVCELSARGVRGKALLARLFPLLSKTSLPSV